MDRSVHTMTKLSRLQRPARRVASSVAILAMVAAIAACGSSKSSNPTNGGASGTASTSAGSANSGGGSGGNSASAPGISSTTIKVGYIQDLSGVLATSIEGGNYGVQARIALQNAEGGVDGRKIDLTTVDTQSAPATALSVTQALVERTGVFAVLEESGFFQAAYRYLQQQNVPVFAAHPIDGDEWSQTSTSNMFEADGAPSATAAPTGFAKLLKSEGVSKVALVSYNLPTSVALLNVIATACQDVGLQVVYEDKALPLPATGVPSVALAIQKSGAEAVLPLLALTDDLAIFNAVKAQGVQLKAPVLASQYGAAITNSPATAAAVEGATDVFPYPPIESNTPATQTMVNALEKYTSWKGEATTGVYFGWISADLFIKGLQLAGRNPTRDSLEAALHGLSNYDAGGLQAPVDLAQNKQGTYSNFEAGNCIDGSRFSNGKFTPLPGNPFCDS